MRNIHLRTGNGSKAVNFEPALMNSLGKATSLRIHESIVFYSFDNQSSSYALE